MRPTTRFAAAAVALVLIVAAAEALSTGDSPGTRAESGTWAHFTGPGSGYVEVADADALDPASEITIEAWVYLRNYLAINDYGEPSIVGKDYLTSYWLGLGLDGRIRFYSHGLGTDVDGNTAIPLNEWVHIAVTYDGTTQRQYINGAIDAESSAFPGPLVANSFPLRIGSDISWDHSPDGFIDEVRIWNVVRTPAEIAANMNNTISAPEPGLVGAWNFDGSFDASVGGFTSNPVGDIELASVVPTPTPPPISPSPISTPAVTATPAPTLGGGLIPGDLDCDGDVDSVDALVVLRHVAALPVNLPGGCPPIGVPIGGLTR